MGSFPEQQLVIEPIEPECNLVSRVLRFFGQRVSARTDSGKLEFYYRKISAVKQCKALRGSQSNKFNFVDFPSLSWRPTTGLRI